MTRHIVEKRSDLARTASLDLQRVFFWSATVLLTITAAAKLCSAAGDARILNYPDVVFPINSRQLLIAVGLVELAVATCVASSVLEAGTKCIVLVWLCSGFLIYRLGLFLLHPGVQCPCLGTITDRLHIDPVTADLILKAMIVYLFGGSAYCLKRMKRLGLTNDEGF